MAVLIIILVLAFIGVLISAFMAGGSEKRKNALLWSAGGVLLSAMTGGGSLFLQRGNQRNPFETKAASFFYGRVHQHSMANHAAIGYDRLFLRAHSFFMEL